MTIKQNQKETIFDQLPKESLNQLKVEDIKNNPRDFLILDFWASWCSPCKESFPFYEKVFTSKKTKNFHFLTISVDEDKKDSISFLNEIGFKNYALWDKDHLFSKKLEIESLPSFLILNSKGEVLFKQIGFSDKKKEKLLEKLKELSI